MKLSDYVFSRPGEQARLARLLGAHAPDVSRWASGGRPVPSKYCVHIEAATAGAVTCEELRPDVRWQRVPDAAWPHPNGRPCIDVAALSLPQAGAAEPTHGDGRSSQPGQQGAVPHAM